MNSTPIAVRRIFRLPNDLINQIAAGEVVERPASVIKELVENSLDAGATRIDILLKEGGLEEIAIIDNGRGIEAEDLPLAVERHTTSKISRLEDLESITSFGFRGEALSSIASVSEMTLKSRTAEMPSAAQVDISFGSAGQLKPVGAPLGTSIQVRNLFLKIPARQKYLRSPATEFSHCVKTIKELALGNPTTNFFLFHQGRKVGQWINPSRLERLKEVLKPDWEPVRYAEENEGMAFEAYLSPSPLMQDRGELFLYVNGRAIKNRNLYSAVRNAFLEVLGPHHDPSGALYLEIRSDWVDVNVHPQKLEIRCLRQERLYPWLLSSLRKQVLPLPKESETIVPALSGMATASGVRILGEIKGSYLVCEDKEGLLLIDGAEFRAKALFERLKISPIRKSPCQIPQVLAFAPESLSLLEENQKTFEGVGFELEPFGDGDVAVKAIPSCLPEFLAEKAIQDALAGGATREAVLSSIAYHSTEMEEFGPLNPEEKSLKGRPLSFRLSFQAIEKYFEK